jgi:probable rRNA maturation factor
MIDVELLGEELAPGGPALAEVRSLCAAAAHSMNVLQGHLAVEYVDEARIAELNAAHRGKDEPADVLSFPIDGVERLSGPVPRELGDIVICPAQTADLREAIVHGTLHLLGMDHETDAGEMLALQRELLARTRP